MKNEAIEEVSIALTIFPSRFCTGENGIANALNQGGLIGYVVVVRHGKTENRKQEKS